MILDTLKNCGLYETIHPRFSKAFDFLQSTDLVALPLGKVELDGKNLFVNVVEITGKTADEVRLETHNRYIDIQMPISADEKMGWIPTSKLQQPIDSYNPEKDVAFFTDKASNFVTVKPGEFAIFFPTDGHQPGIADGVVKKLIVKVLI
ncbi:MAG: YhcH/YjgK/YiaL family protein [Paludibacter sp.]